MPLKDKQKVSIKTEHEKSNSYKLMMREDPSFLSKSLENVKYASKVKKDGDTLLHLLADVPENTFLGIDHPNYLSEFVKTQVYFRGRTASIFSHVAEQHLNTLNKLHETPLLTAATRNNVPLMKALLFEKADPNVGNHRKRTALHFAAIQGMSELIPLLAASGANLDALDDGDFSALTSSILFRTAYTPNVITALLKAGASSHSILPHIPPAALFAMSEGQVDLVQAILAERPDNQYLTHHGINLLHFAAQKASAAWIERLIVAGFAVDSRRGGRNGQTPLMMAAYLGRTEIVKILLKHGANPNLCDSQNSDAVIMATSKNHLDTVRALLEHKATDKNKVYHFTNEKSYFALLEASYHNNSKMMAVLCLFGADLNASHDKTTVIHQVVSHKKTAIVQYLSAKKLNFRVFDDSGFSALHIASVFGLTDIINLLLKAGVPYDLQSPKENVPISTPLHVAALVGNIDSLTCFVAHNVNLNLVVTSPECYGVKSSVLGFALHGGDRADIIKYLLAHNATPHQADTSAIPLLHLAAKFDRIESLKLIIEKLKIDGKLTENINLIFAEKTALSIAAEAENSEIVKQLIDAGAEPISGTDTFYYLQKLAKKKTAIQSFLRKYLKQFEPPALSIPQSQLRASDQVAEPITTFSSSSNTSSMTVGSIDISSSKTPTREMSFNELVKPFLFNPKILKQVFQQESQRKTLKIGSLLQPEDSCNFTEALGFEAVYLNDNSGNVFLINLAGRKTYITIFYDIEIDEGIKAKIIHKATEQLKNCTGYARDGGEGLVKISKELVKLKLTHKVSGRFYGKFENLNAYISAKGKGHFEILPCIVLSIFLNNSHSHRKSNTVKVIHNLVDTAINKRKKLVLEYRENQFLKLGKKIERKQTLLIPETPKLKRQVALSSQLLKSQTEIQVMEKDLKMVRAEKINDRGDETDDEIPTSLQDNVWCSFWSTPEVAVQTITTKDTNNMSKATIIKT